MDGTLSLLWTMSESTEWLMTCIAVRCPHGDSAQLVTRGKTPRGTQRSLGQHTACVRGSGRLDYRHRGGVPEVKQARIDMRLNAHGVRDPARVLRLRTDPVRSALHPRAAARASVHTTRRRPVTPEAMAVHLERAGEADLDARGSVVGQKPAQRWWWQAIAHGPGAVVADVCGRRQDEVCVRLKARLEPCGITRDPPDHGGAAARHRDPAAPHAGKRHPQHSERHHWTWRTRMTRVVRTTICCSKSTPMHDLVMGVLVNR
jgi:IS1 family transposase/transposase-like protein